MKGQKHAHSHMLQGNNLYQLMPVLLLHEHTTLDWLNLVMVYVISTCMLYMCSSGDVLNQNSCPRLVDLISRLYQNALRAIGAYFCMHLCFIIIDTIDLCNLCFLLEFSKVALVIVCSFQFVVVVSTHKDC